MGLGALGDYAVIYCASAFAALRMLCGQCSDDSCNAQANAGRFCRLLSWVRKDDTMNKPECLKRAAECTRLAEATSDPRYEDLFNEARPIVDAGSHGSRA
jgi:hypothetical protein